MAKPGLELILGGKTDPAFGKVITFGMGGTLVELMKDVTLRILPVHESEIRTMVKEINAYPLISGYRGMKPRDEESLIAIITGVARFFEENPNVMEFDINPLRLYESGACAVDARIIVDDDYRPVGRKQRKLVPPEYFTPRSVAVIGASSDQKKMGYAVLHNLLHFPGQIYPVNNKRTEVQGLEVVPDRHRHSKPGRPCRDHCAGRSCAKGDAGVRREGDPPGRGHHGRLQGDRA